MNLLRWLTGKKGPPMTSPTAVPSRLVLDKHTGKLTDPTGHTKITHNHPFPCVNGKFPPTGAMQGVLMHTMVGWLGDYTHGTVELFNREGEEASANFGVGQDGSVWQFGPIGKGWESWHAEAANLTWYGIEFEDGGNPDNPISDKALRAGAQLVEFLSSFAGFPLRVTDRPAGSGFGTHVMGGLAWSHDGHTCPDKPPRHVRSQQRQEIIDLAKQIRNGGTTPPPAATFKAPDNVWTTVPGHGVQVQPLHHDVVLKYRDKP